MNELTIGGKYPPMAGKAEGVYFDVDASGPILIYNFESPTQKEINALQSGNRFDLWLSVISNVLFVTAKAADLSIVDAPFAPQLARGELPEVGDDEGYLLTVLLIDAAANTIKAIRAIGLSHEFSVVLYGEIERVMALPFSEKAFMQKQYILSSIYCSENIARVAIAGFRLREKEQKHEENYK